MREYFLILACILFLISCRKEEKEDKAISEIHIELNVIRFDRLFAEASPNEIPRLRNDFPYLFPAQYADSLWVAKLTDTLQIEIQEEVNESFGNFEQETSDLEMLFKYFKFHFPDFRAPKVITLLSEVQYQSRVVLTDSLLLVGLDNYLGKEHRFYAGLPNYVAKILDKRYLTSDVASALAKKVNPYPRDRTFLSRMVYHGKELYLKDKFLPHISNAQKIGYTDEEFDWAQDNEDQIWRYFIQQELLYSTDTQLDSRFLDPAPFSKFGLELDSESPGRLGRYIGWQIVRAYMNRNPKADLAKLLDLPADELFKESNYKPKR